MMLSKQKPDDEKVEVTQSIPAPVAAAPEETCDDEREQELERRLAMLGTGDETKKEEEHTDEQPTNDDLISFDPLAAAPVAVEAAKPEPTVTTAAPAAAVKPNKSALLARIMAAQERAKQAQMKQISSDPTVAAAPLMQNQSTTTFLPAPEQVTFNANLEKEKMMKALSGIGDATIQKETRFDDLKPPSMPPPPQFMAPPPTATATPFPVAPSPTTMAMPPPPSFDIFEQQQMKQSAPLPPPPAFGAIENNLFDMPTAQAPSAPPQFEESLLDGFNGLMPMAPPPTYPTEQVQEEDDAFAFDIDGNPLTPEQKRKMMEEQRAIMEQIQRQANENKASEAAIRADAFENRMTGNPTVSDTTTNNTPATEEIATAVDVGSFDPAEVEEQRKILEAIEKQVRKAQSSTIGDYQSPAAASSNTQQAAPDTVDIGDGKKVALHGQEKTKAAIKDGTAVLVQCVNCDNWMQVTGAATLMFCPICSVVSPVLRDGKTHTTEDVRQMDEDRKLAEQLQAEENAAAGEYPANRRLQTAPKEEEVSWWDTLMVGMGVATTPEESGDKHSAEINVSRPPGSMTPSQRTLHSAVTGDRYEREGLLGSGGGGRGGGEARVAESKPMFSCVVDSVSNAAYAAAAGVSSMAYDDEEEVHGIDTTSFLAVPKIGDDRDPSSSYKAIPNDD